jgi:hypothetical protein
VIFALKLNDVINYAYGNLLSYHDKLTRPRRLSVFLLVRHGQQFFKASINPQSLTGLAQG